MAHDTARVSPRLHQTHENWEASHDFPRFSDVSSRLVQVRTSSNLRSGVSVGDTLRADVCRVETAYWVWVRFISDGFSNPLSASDEYPALNIWKLDKENGSS